MIEKQFKYSAPFALECGDALPELEIRYHVSQASAEGKKVIWICHALTANSDPSEWWDQLVGPGKYFDTDKHFIICANIVGSCYGTTGPQSLNPRSGKPYFLSFPIVSIRDMVGAHELLRKHLGIPHIDLLIGGSSGGFQALEWAVTHPEVVENLCLLACNAKISPWGTALNESQRMALRADREFEQQADMSAAKRGLACARSIALLSYRSYEGYGQSQAETDPDCFMAGKASSYQRYQGEKLVKRFNAYSYYCLTLGLDTHNVGRGRGGVNAALKQIRARTLCIAVDSDGLFPREEMEFVAQNIPHAVCETIESIYGHDGFLLEYEQIIGCLKRNFNL